MKLHRILPATLAATALFLGTPACQMQTAETMAPAKKYPDDKKATTEPATAPDPANPEPPKYFNQ